MKFIELNNTSDVPFTIRVDAIKFITVEPGKAEQNPTLHINVGISGHTITYKAADAQEIYDRIKKTLVAVKI